MRLWHCYLSLFASLILMLASTFMDKHFATQLGFKWQPAFSQNNHQQGWQVTASRLPQVQAGSLLTDVFVDHTWVKLDNQILLSTPDYAASLSSVIRSFNLEQKLYELRLEPIRFKQSNGHVVDVQAKPANWSELGVGFWLYRGLYLLGMLLAWITLYWYENASKEDKQYTPDNEASGRLLLCLSLVCSSLTLVLSVAAMSRSWAVPDWYLWTKFIANMTAVAFSSLLFLRLWLTQPSYLPNRHGLWRALWLGACIIYAFNLVFLLAQASFAISYLRASSNLLAVLFIGVFSVQWWLTRKDGVSLVDKVSMRMLFAFGVFACILFSTLNFVVFHYWQHLTLTPNLMLGLISITSNAVLFLLLFRHQLYRIAYWWWLFYALLVGALVLLVSFALFSQFGLRNDPMDIGISVLASLFAVLGMSFFFQYRQLRSHVNLLLNASLLLQKLRQVKVNSNAFWAHQKQLFMQALDAQKAEIIELKATQSKIQIICGGEKIQLGITAKHGLRLSAPNKGKRLFNERDVKTLSMLQELSNAQQREQAAFAAGEKQTRMQIAHDLHDDIGGRLHQLAYEQSEQVATYAQETLDQLRTLTHALHQDAQPLEILLAQLRHSVLRRGEGLAVHIICEINVEKGLNSQLVSSLGVMQIQAVISELCRNALQHQGVSNIRVQLDINATTCQLDVFNDGAKTRVQDWEEGVGLSSIRRRAYQLGGQVSWLANAQGGVTTQLIFSTPKWFAL